MNVLIRIRIRVLAYNAIVGNIGENPLRVSLVPPKRNFCFTEEKLLFHRVKLFWNNGFTNKAVIKIVLSCFLGGAMILYRMLSKYARNKIKSGCSRDIQ